MDRNLWGVPKDPPGLNRVKTRTFDKHMVFVKSDGFGMVLINLFQSYHWVLSFISHLKTIFSNQISGCLKKRAFTVKPSQEGEAFLQGYEIFFRDSCSFPCIKTLLKVSNPVFDKNPT